MSELYQKSLSDLHDLLVKKEISATELTQATLDRIEKVEPNVDAFLSVTKSSALEQAEKIDQEGISESELLKGLPIGIKDNIVTKGILTTAASKILHNFNPIYDATVMERVKSTGLITVGKLNMDEFAMGGSTENSSFKQTKNAWNHTKVPGGSSGGSAAAVASGEVPLSLGSDTGGSIRQPASFNGIVGMKPTYGRVSRFGLIAFASSLDQIGPLTRNVRDNALALTAISGFDEKDGTSAKREVPDFAKYLNGDIQGMKIALPKEYLGEGIDEKVKQRILEAAETFRKLGATVEEVSLPHSKYGVAVYYIIASSEASSNLQRFDGIRYGYRTEQHDNLEEVYVKSRTEGFGEEVKRRIMLGTFSLSAGYYDAYFKKAGQVRTLILQDFQKVFETYDLIIGPTAPTVAYDLGSNIADPITMYLSDLLTIPVNLAGLPGMSIPAGFSDGLPVGLQIIGKHFDEQTMYNAAFAFENATAFHKELPSIMGGVAK
ncbi:aspartyl/glutamyl-tRNA(Asn/Gln) amidotransferase subunit A [Pilibacter termitis]|uniref:Glutamyl-tRNA(Gln) amidotransferase subunit A n=1 Tax=Pilibacter termitis TaxID=263852 RepID=A0A1T4L5E3_9ENTE|nr:Asp-tRNA(Asn)/Glu-tRNA(Gln) amidotransferase subunit GatA [Pilibacter termitis]SJZ49945.1 aspartyl/glutamyl-tRNA(Asn/Gln) amidotransferase subunit A [Pilibacter termitis]